MFDRIARCYDFVNLFISLGMHQGWRKKMMLHLPDCKDQNVLDLATGTGDVAFTLARESRVAKVTGLDLSTGMLTIAGKKAIKDDFDHKVRFIEGDAQHIPAKPQSYDAITISFGIRNVPNTSKCLADALRVLKPGGKMIILESALPRSRILRFFSLIHVRYVLPVLGWLLSGDPYAYRYLDKTIRTYPHGKDFLAMMVGVGFKNTGFQSLALGGVNLYWGEKQ